MYEVTINGQEVGYIQNDNQLKTYIKEKLGKKETSIAFVEIEDKPEIKLKLVNRKEKDSLEQIIQQIDDHTMIEYTTYAITYDGQNKTYVATKDQAQELINHIKKQYNSQYTDHLGILQVYSNAYNEIEALELEKATVKISKTLDKAKMSNQVKIAKTTKVNTEAYSKKTNDTKNTVSKNPKKQSTTIKGVSFVIKPVNGIITSRFGYRNSPGGIGSTNHKGLDISAKKGTIIKAAASGTVKFAGSKGSLGNLVIISNGKGVETYYAHCSKIYVSKGQKIKAGQQIAAVGQTGAATGPHLHLEIHVNGTVVNPQNYLY